MANCNQREKEMTEDKIQNTNPYILAWHITPQGRRQNINASDDKYYGAIAIGVVLFFASLVILYHFL